MKRSVAVGGMAVVMIAGFVVRSGIVASTPRISMISTTGTS